MKRKSAKTVQKRTLVIGEMIEITDPAEKAALDRRFREAEKALQIAKNAGPESIQCFNNCTQTRAAPVAFLSPNLRR